jgi:predicted nucleic acid-binding protein
MILADSSVWINHFRRNDPKLAGLLEQERIVTHLCVIGELALGNLTKRNQAIHDLQRLPQIPSATDTEILEWIERRRMFGKGIGWVDAHVLLSCILNGAELWTFDKQLALAARSCGAKLYS